MTGEERVVLERRLAARAAYAALSKEQAQQWQRSKFTARCKVQSQKTFVVFQLEDDSVKILDVYKVVKAGVDFQSGMSVLLRSNQGRDFWVTHTPTQIENYPVFGHIPFMPEVTFVESLSKPATFRFPLVFRQLDNPSIGMEQNLPMLTDVPALQARFPQFLETQF